MTGFPEILDKVMDMLMDGEWHSVGEIAEKFGLEEFKAKLIATFLTQYDFCIGGYGGVGDFGSIKLKARIIRFFKELKEVSNP